MLSMAALVAAAAACDDFATSGLRLNQAQLLATHNSYHLASGLWNYTWPPLYEQLNVGVRGFEIDLFFDATVSGGELRVMHVPGMDEGSTCATLADCLADVRAWSDQNPRHFPIFFQLELMGGVAISDGTDGCTMAELELALACAAANCVGELPGDLVTCMTSNCLLESLSAYRANPLCANFADCLETETGELDQTVPLTRAVMLDTTALCVSSGADGYTGVALDDTSAAAALSLVASTIDTAFPAERRVAPASVCGDDWVQNWPDVCDDGRASWPEVDASLGKAVFWLTQMGPWTGVAETAIGGASSQVFFMQGLEDAIQKVDDPSSSDTDSHAQQGVIVRTRADVDDEGPGPFSERRAAALGSGAQMLSTDFVRPLSEGWANALPEDSMTFWLPGGSPVRCNPVTASSVSDCTALQFEDPATVKCGGVTTTTSTTTTSTTIMVTTTTPAPSVSVAASAAAPATSTILASSVSSQPAANGPSDDNDSSSGTSDSLGRRSTDAASHPTCAIVIAAFAWLS